MMLNKNNADMKVYIYRLTSDTGLAPCVHKGLLSLAVCKGGQIRNGKPCNSGLRHQIAVENEFASKQVYILGTYHDKFLYLAKVTNVVTMEEYFSGMSTGRTDDIYSLVNGKLERNNNLREFDVHTEFGRIIRDLAGQYVVLSNDYIYLGRDAANIGVLKQYYPKFQETKTYTHDIASFIISECEEYRDKKKHIPNEPYNVRCGGCK